MRAEIPGIIEAEAEITRALANDMSGRGLLGPEAVRPPFPPTGGQGKTGRWITSSAEGRASKGWRKHVRAQKAADRPIR